MNQFDIELSKEQVKLSLDNYITKIYKKFYNDLDETYLKSFVNYINKKIKNDTNEGINSINENYKHWINDKLEKNKFNYEKDEELFVKAKKTTAYKEKLLQLFLNNYFAYVELYNTNNIKQDECNSNKDIIEDDESDNEEIKVNIKKEEIQQEEVTEEVTEEVNEEVKEKTKEKKAKKERVKQSEYIILQNNENKNEVIFMYGDKHDNNSKIKKKYSSYNILKRELYTDPNKLYTKFKDTIKEEYTIQKENIKNDKKLKNKTELKKRVEKIKFTRNTLTLQYDYKVEDLLNKIEEIKQSL
jgi:hypothetical protein